MLRRFTCPRCGSHEYGTENAVSNPVRRCAGRVNVDRAKNKTSPCGFEWPEQDDHKWGLGPLEPVPVAATRAERHETLIKLDHELLELFKRVGTIDPDDDRAMRAGQADAKNISDALGFLADDAITARQKAGAA